MALEMGGKFPAVPPALTRPWAGGEKTAAVAVLNYIVPGAARGGYDPGRSFFRNAIFSILLDKLLYQVLN
jgi:hypothetical protein